MSIEYDLVIDGVCFNARTDTLPRLGEIIEFEKQKYEITEVTHKLKPEKGNELRSEGLIMFTRRLPINHFFEKS